jgi:hypothetical protein
VEDAGSVISNLTGPVKQLDLQLAERSDPMRVALE